MSIIAWWTFFINLFPKFLGKVWKRQEICWIQKVFQSGIYPRAFFKSLVFCFAFMAASPDLAAWSPEVISVGSLFGIPGINAEIYKKKKKMDDTVYQIVEIDQWKWPYRIGKRIYGGPRIARIQKVWFHYSVVNFLIPKYLML